MCWLTFITYIAFGTGSELYLVGDVIMAQAKHDNLQAGIVVRVVSWIQLALLVCLLGNAEYCYSQERRSGDSSSQLCEYHGAGWFNELFSICVDRRRIHYESSRPPLMMRDTLSYTPEGIAILMAEDSSTLQPFWEDECCKDLLEGIGSMARLLLGL